MKNLESKIDDGNLGTQAHQAFVPTSALATSVIFEDDRIHVRLSDGRIIAVPLGWFPRLRDASQEHRANYLIAAGGRGLHWPDVDEVLSVAGLLAGAESDSANTGEHPMSRDQVLKVLHAFKVTHAEEYRLLSLGIFGSFARDEAKFDSDVDVVFQTDQPNLLRTASMQADLQDLLARRVDVVRLREDMNPGLKQRIQKEAYYV